MTGAGFDTTGRMVVYIPMAAENSFDIVCKIDMQEVTNALDQARREIETRYDLKGTKNEVTLDKTDIILVSPDDMKLKAVIDILQSKLHRRGVPLKALSYGTVEQASGGALRQKISLQQGIPMEKAKEIVRLVKDSKIRVQAAIHEDKVRISGKSRDDLQTVMKLVRDTDFGIAISFDNRRTI
jgi:cyclic-di-GMP-binding protein